MKKIIVVLLVVLSMVVFITWLNFASEYDYKSEYDYQEDVWELNVTDPSTVNILKESFKIDQRNKAISGLSVNFATDMLANGTQGKSLEQLIKFLDTSVDNKNKELQEKLKNLPKTLEVSNSIWGNKFNKTYKKLLKKILDVSVESLPENTDVINNWIAKKTHGKIPSVLKSEPTNFRDLYLVNTVYFKDNWAKSFDKENTREKIFHSLSGEDKNVPMMYRKGGILYAENSKVQSVVLPYKKGGFMVIYLPREGVDFKEFISNLSDNELITNHTYETVALSLPKFKIDKETDVKRLFQNLGITEIFNEDNDDLVNITKNGAYVKDIKQKAVVEIDEVGTTASAATSVHLRIKGVEVIEELVKTFDANRPFLFFITQGDFIGVYTGDE